MTTQLNFHDLKRAVEKQFAVLAAKGPLFVTGVTGDEMWNCYLRSFPAGTNPIYRERTEHDCSCCRQFIKKMGNVVTIVDGERLSIWDCEVGDPNYQAVVNAMAATVRLLPITDVFLHYESSVGIDKNYEQDGVQGLDKVITWDHFHVDLPRSNTHSMIQRKDKIPTMLGEYRALHDVLLRSLNELTRDAVDTVLELIAQNSLYRGEEHKFAVAEFKKVQTEAAKLAMGNAIARDNFVWSRIMDLPGSVAKIRNTSIGTLLIDLSEGMELEQAVKKFEQVVAPANYKRPTALVTKAMVEKARETVKELGLDTALERRYAKVSDISVNNIIFADRSARKVMKDVFDDIETKGSKPKNLDKVETISIEKFVADVVPNVDTIEVLFENKHAGNLVSLIAPQHADAAKLFKWDNGFSWTYNGDLADSIKERVKQAGGNVTGDLCCRLAWYNFDDLDFHMKEPGGHEIYFRDKGPSDSGGRLDVDMNAGSGQTRTPVENIYYGDRRRMRAGIYSLFVHQYNQREASNFGFEAEIDFMGTVYRFVYEKPMRTNNAVVVASFRYDPKTDKFEIIESLPSTQASKTIWNLPTQQFHKVHVMMLSPNHWDDQGVGNKHYFFMLEGCQNEGQARGFYNEFLRADLDKHRKVLEILGSKTKTEESANQLSGLGMSSTKRDQLTVRVKGNFTRTLNVTF